MRKLLALGLVFFMGCASTKNVASSGQVGCPANEIVISEEDTPLFGGSVSWAATCRGKKFYCSSITSGMYGGATVTCKPAIP
jgi:hypothetical protein